MKTEKGSVSTKVENQGNFVLEAELKGLTLIPIIFAAVDVTDKAMQKKEVELVWSFNPR